MEPHRRWGRKWESQVADKRIHGTTRKQVATCFEEELAYITMNGDTTATYRIGNTTVTKIPELTLSGFALTTLLPELKIETLKKHPDWVDPQTIDPVTGNASAQRPYVAGENAQAHDLDRYRSWE